MANERIIHLPPAAAGFAAARPLGANSSVGRQLAGSSTDLAESERKPCRTLA